MQLDELTRRPDGVGRGLAHGSLPAPFCPRAGGGGRRRAGAALPLATIAFDPETYGGALVPFIAAYGVGADCTSAARGRRRAGRPGALASAASLYRSAGYTEIGRFNANPYAHHWFEKRLGDALP